MADANTVGSIIDRLEKTDPTRFLSMIYFMKNYPVTSIEEAGGTVIMRGKSDRDWVFLACPEETEFTEAVKRLSESDRCFAAAEDWMIPLLAKDKKIVWDLPLIKWIFPHEIRIPDTEDMHITRLSPEDSEYIYENSMYREFLTPDYIRSRIQNGPGAAVYDGGRPAAWIATQDDSAMGFLHVMEQYRGRGYARQLTLYMIRNLREKGIVPFVYIQEQNSASCGLAAALGFRRDREIHWCEIA